MIRVVTFLSVLLLVRIAAFAEAPEARVNARHVSDVATQLYREGKSEEAAQHFEKALEGDTTRALRRHIYLYLGKSYESTGRIDKAIAAYEQAEQYDAKNWKRHRDLAGLYEKARLYRKAVLSYHEAMKLNPKEGSLPLSLGRTLRKDGFYKEALVPLTKAIDLGADTHEIHHELSLVYEGQSQFQAAVVAQVKSMGEKPSKADFSRLAYLAALAGDKENAKRAFNGFKSLPDSYETALFYDSLLLLIQQKPEQILAMTTHNTDLQKLLRTIEREGAE